MPADDVLAVILPVGRFLVRAPQLIVALSHIAAYPNGCMLHMLVSTRSGGHGLDHRDVGDGFERMAFAVRFGTETSAVTDQEEPWRRRSRGEDALLLVRYGYQGSHGGAGGETTGEMKLWLHPLPPRQAGTLEIVAPDLGPLLTGCPLDGHAIVAAAAKAQPYRL